MLRVRLNMPLVREVSFDISTGAVNGKCTTTTAGDNLTPCLAGRYTNDPFLSFFLNDTRTGTLSDLRAVDKQWRFKDDAPSFILRYNHGGGEIAMLTNVKRANHCNILKLCLERGDGVDIVTPLGIVLDEMDKYGPKCTRPE